MARLLVIPALRCVVLICVALSVYLDAQGPVAYEVVSIKRNNAGVQAGGGLRYLPDGTLIMTNQPIRSIILGASPVPVREVVGLPDWATVERYDVTAKPPADSTREQRGQMMRTLFAERMKLVAHVEERERDAFALVLARADGRLGPQLKPSTVDCNARPAGAAPTPPSPPPAEVDIRNRCGMMMSATSIASGGISMDSLAQSLSGLAGGLVNNRTGLKGFYALELNHSRSGLAAADDQRLGNEPPEFVTALQEQLGLKLQPEKTMVPVLVVDSIERPTEN